jgi:hypothetical protein
VIFGAAKRAYFDAALVAEQPGADSFVTGATKCWPLVPETVGAVPRAKNRADPSGAAFLIAQDLRYVVAEGDALRRAGKAPTDFVGKSVMDVLGEQEVSNIRRVHKEAYSSINTPSAPGGLFLEGRPLRTERGASRGRSSSRMT